MVADLWDLTRQATGTKKQVNYPRPFAAAPETSQHGNAAGRTPEQIKALLSRARAGLPEAPV